MLSKVLRTLVISTYALMILAPVVIAIDRLWAVTGVAPWQAFGLLSDLSVADGALLFTCLVSASASLLTLAFGLPLAIVLAKYEWKNIALIRAILVLPFVCPAIVAAMGFLVLFDAGGPLNYVGIDLYQQSGIIGTISASLGFANIGHFIALSLALCWFNLSLVIRFIEPTLANMNPDWEDQLKLLPQGKSLCQRIRHLYAPILAPGIIASAGLTFVFSFTSFALVRWLAPSADTLETLMADYGGSAGIYGYRVMSSEIVLACSVTQIVILGFSLWLVSHMQSLHQSRIAIVAESFRRKQQGKAKFGHRAILLVGVVFAILPLLLTLISSFKMRVVENGQVSTEWTTQGWSIAWRGDLSYAGAGEALGYSLVYAALTLVIAMPLGWMMAATIHSLEKEGKLVRAKIVDFISFAPLIVSAVMAGLGILLGIIMWFPELFAWFLLPVWAHIMMVTPFVVRVMLPALRSMDERYIEQAKILRLNQ
ncbi:MAG TPA: iron ABC transporter permease, partial [Candidatus Poseidoniales archaeon]|nr:iron ABC transporter permease [Candidatus Poseidoniales archaeon]